MRAAEALADSWDQLAAEVFGPTEAGRALRIGHRSTELVGSAASMFSRYRPAERVISVLRDAGSYMTLGGEQPVYLADGTPVLRRDPGAYGLETTEGDKAAAAAAAGTPWMLPAREAHLTHVGQMTRELGYLRVRKDRVQGEGPQVRIEISPGAVKIARTDPVKRDRARARALVAAAVKARAEWQREQYEPCWDGCLSPSCQGCRRHDLAKATAKITVWSRKSRRSMIYRLATLDYAPLFVNWFGTNTCPAMVTLTYPGDWEAVAPSNRAVGRHIDALRKRWNRMFANLGFPLIGVWKREFQERGAPHYHILCVPPDVPWFSQWLGENWAEIVAAEWCGSRCWEAWKPGSDFVSVHRPKGIACCERGRHVVAGTGIDYHEGARATDPRRLAVYFAKHGGYAAKEYQNEGPALWAERGGVGRFWGVWGLDTAIASVHLSPETGQLVARTIRRLERSKRYYHEVMQLRCELPEADEVTGELLHEHGRGCFRERTICVRRFKGSAGYVVVNDGPALAAALARVAGLAEQDQRERIYTTAGGAVRRGTSGSGPVGFLP